MVNKDSIQVYIIVLSFGIVLIGIFDFVFHLVELSRGLLLLNLPYRTVPGILANSNE